MLTAPTALLPLDAAPMLALLDLRSGDPLDAGLVVDRGSPHPEGGLLLSFAVPPGRHTVGLQLRPRDDAQPAWRRTRHLDLVTHIPADLDAAAVLAALAPLVARLDALDGPSTRVTVPPPAGERPPPALRVDVPAERRDEAPSLYDFGRVHVLDLASDCQQACRFCSARTRFSPVARFDEAAFRAIVASLERARADGYDVLRLSGLDPLTHPRVTDCVAEATRLGFDHVHIYSPSTRYDDPAFLDALIRALGPTGFTLHVPLYGGDGATHDRVSGTPGSFQRVLAGLGLLAERGLLSHVLFVTVVTADNAPALPALRRLTASYGRPVHVFLPFPATPDPRDRFFEVALRQSELVAPMLACEPPLGLSALLPCVRWAHERRTGQPAWSRGGVRTVAALDGNLFELGTYRRMDDGPQGGTFRIPVRRCPHASACALAELCPRAVYEAYAERFGTGELVPVDAAELSGWSG
ncbi:MAG: radical SAM protein [Deltaproteobacteria bacterium]|nr:radical SAM protein [Deltaproteobacteria bacterium]